MTDRMGMLWTNEEVNDLKKEINDGLQLEEIVQRHGRTPYAIVGRLQSLDILVLIGRNYHRVDPDPWVLGSAVQEMQKGQRDDG